LCGRSPRRYYRMLFFFWMWMVTQYRWAREQRGQLHQVSDEAALQHTFEYLTSLGTILHCWGSRIFESSCRRVHRQIVTANCVTETVTANCVTYHTLRLISILSDNGLCDAMTVMFECWPWWRWRQLCSWCRLVWIDSRLWNSWTRGYEEATSGWSSDFHSEEFKRTEVWKENSRRLSAYSVLES
jgi:hypothetical protein